MIISIIIIIIIIMVIISSIIIMIAIISIWDALGRSCRMSLEDTYYVLVRFYDCMHVIIYKSF